MAAGPNGIFLAEDSHQRIYGQRLVLSRFGISTRGRASKRLTLNYRTTQEVLNYAVRMLEGETWVDSEGAEDSTQQYRSARSGPQPHIIPAATEAKEIAKVANAIKEWNPDGDNVRVGVLARTQRKAKEVEAALSEQGITLNNNVRVMTMHSAKGLEFTHVALMGVNNTVLPLPYVLNGLDTPEKDDFLQRERALLYVAASRARDQLLITYSGAKSTLLP